MQDLELGRRAGLAQPRNIRQVIKKLQKRGRLPGILMRTATMRIEIGPKNARTGDRLQEVDEFWLNRREALVVVNALETPPAEAMQDEMIRVFEAALDGKLPGQMTAEMIRAIVREETRAIVREETASLRATTVDTQNDIKVLKESPRSRSGSPCEPPPSNARHRGARLNPPDPARPAPARGIVMRTEAVRIENHRGPARVPRRRVRLLERWTTLCFAGHDAEPGSTRLSRCRLSRAVIPELLGYYPIDGGRDLAG